MQSDGPAPQLPHFKQTPIEGNAMRPASDHWTCLERIAHKLFPHAHASAPDLPCATHDVICTRVKVDLDWKDRLRVLISGRCEVMTATATEHRVGRNACNSVFFAVAPRWTVSRHTRFLQRHDNVSHAHTPKA